MIPVFRPRRAAVLPAGLLLLGSLVAIGCEKVPLLAPTGSTITLTAATTALPLGGTTTLIAQVIAASGQPPHEGTLVTFTTTLGTVQPAQVETDINGRVIVQFNAGNSSGTATISASSGGAGATTTTTNGTTTTTAANVVKIAIGAAAVGGVSVSANPPTVPASGGSSTITATISDAAGNLLSRVPVTFTTDHGSVAPALVNTDANGNAQTTLTTNVTAKVTASAGVASTGTTPTIPSGNVTVNVNITQPITVGTIVPSSPTVGQTVTVPLTYASTTGATQLSRVVVDWGDGAVVSYPGEPGAVTHTYFRAGSYLIQITGTDTTGDRSTTSAAVTVGGAPKPTVGVSVDNDRPLVNTAVTFTVTASVPNSTTDAIQNTHLDYGDGSSVDLGSAATSSPKHTYASSGTKTATATTTDTNSATATAQVTVNVQ